LEGGRATQRRNRNAEAASHRSANQKTPYNLPDWGVGDGKISERRKKGNYISPSIFRLRKEGPALTADSLTVSDNSHEEVEGIEARVRTIIQEKENCQRGGTRGHGVDREKKNRRKEGDLTKQKKRSIMWWGLGEAVLGQIK